MAPVAANRILSASTLVPRASDRDASTSRLQTSKTLDVRLFEIVGNAVALCEALTEQHRQRYREDAPNSVCHFFDARLDQQREPKLASLVELEGLPQKRLLGFE